MHGITILMFLILNNDLPDCSSLLYIDASPLTEKAHSTGVGWPARVFS